VDVDPKVLKEPAQSPLAEKEIKRFEKDDYAYEILPLYEYEISGLVVHRMDYTWLGLYKIDSAFPIDLCLMWGENVKNGVYRNKSLKFSQDMRHCWYEFEGEVAFNEREVSNNHILIESEGLRKKLESVNTGDQVRIKGKLVNVFGRNIGNPGRYDPDMFNMTTSISRDDQDAGACEIIYLEEIEILKKGNFLSNLLYRASLWGLAVIVLWSIIGFFWSVITLRL